MAGRQDVFHYVYQADSQRRSFSSRPLNYVLQRPNGLQLRIGSNFLPSNPDYFRLSSNGLPNGIHVHQLWFRQPQIATHRLRVNAVQYSPGLMNVGLEPSDGGPQPGIEQDAPQPDHQPLQNHEQLLDGQPQQNEELQHLNEPEGIVNEPSQDDEEIDNQPEQNQEQPRDDLPQREEEQHRGNQHQQNHVEMQDHLQANERNPPPYYYSGRSRVRPMGPLIRATLARRLPPRLYESETPRKRMRKFMTATGFSPVSVPVADNEVVDEVLFFV